MSNPSTLQKTVHARILLVDDNLTNVMILEKMLRIQGYYNIQSLTDSREVVAAYQSFQPDLILLDLMMPYMDGFEVLEKLNEIKGDDYLSVVIVTAQNDKKNRLRGYELGAKDFVGKPFDHIEVMMRIGNLLEMRMLHNKVRLHNILLEEKVGERTKELYNMQFELVNRLLMAVEFRDGSTGKHIVRIGSYVCELGMVMGFSDEECKKLFYAVMMHDIGKISIPDEILLKPGKLNDDEWEKMKAHTSKGAEILRGSSLEIIQMAEQIAITHHERWDGTGYPNGLKGEEIPLIGRISAVVDVFDALLNSRVYKDAWTMDKVFEHFKQNSGSHFDPIIVDAFLAQKDRFIQIKDQFE